ncbi:PE family protein [Mycobacterium nebraskense]|uniref:PE domain-containing protein n=1 Tax=Mycobacterium nebraskense TaxID=244292 RepID=A0A1X1YTY6_9MYCO|nr:PE family protein [Mycobacterium nebraskense]KKC04499.1 hypothetical protein WU83_13380 [Mycobacterium nebraskense]MBI2692755.1 PE family protein [Mycobacterium nebraskense]MCV7115787.1 PE family protein [Mycobacterium nebraskense]ORW14510.1 hypothetical protein AWC17_19885 [Mycobacterium nebraskense]
MPFETRQLGQLVEAVSNLPGVNSTLAAQYADAAVPTVGVVPPAGDVISAVTAARFSAHGQAYQTVYSQAAVALDLLARVLGATVAAEAPTMIARAAEVG